MFDELLKKSAELKEKTEALRQEAAELVGPMLSEFIKTNPQVKGVKWTQYTPHFNDGEACVFRIHTPYFFFDGDDMDEDEGHDLCWLKLPRPSYAPVESRASDETLIACQQLGSALKASQEALEQIFGDHVQVIVTADGVSVDEYDHD